MLSSSRFDFDQWAASEHGFDEVEMELRHQHFRLATSTVNERPARIDFGAQIHQLAESRRQLIFRVRRQIAEGNYDTPERWEAALDRLFEAVEAGSASANRQ